MKSPRPRPRPRPRVTRWTLEEKSEIRFESSCRSSQSEEFDGVCLRPSFLLLILYDSEKSRSPAGRRRDTLTSHMTQLNAPIRPAETNLMWHHARKLNMKWDHRTTFCLLMRFWRPGHSCSLSNSIRPVSVCMNVITEGLFSFLQVRFLFFVILLNQIWRRQTKFLCCKLQIMFCCSSS